MSSLKIMHAMGIRFLRTYNVHLPEAEKSSKSHQGNEREDPSFSMFVMLGAWID